MELNNLIKELIDSGMTENQELGLTMLSSDQVSDEEKRELIDRFIKDYQSGVVNFFDEEHKRVFHAWVEIYLALQVDEVKKRRVKRIP